MGSNRPTFMEGVKTIYVPTFRNLTLVPRIEVLVAETLIRQMQEDGTYKIASSLDDADAVLEGDVIRFSRNPSRTVIGDVQTTEEFDMMLAIHYRVIRKATGELVDDRTTTGSTSFFVSGDVNQDERQAIPLAAQNAATHIVSEISEGW
jgi:curli biogenesis system outer membrane secretion channel CsgG